MREIGKTSKSLLRREKILSLLSESDDITTSALAKHFKVSDYTIRRDLNVLAAENKIRRHHGGAKNTDSPLLTGRRDNRTQVKQAKQLLPFIYQGCHMYIDSPYLAEALVSLLPDINIKILTNDLKVHHLITHKENISMYFLGGSFGRREEGFHYPDFIYRGEFESIDIAIIEVDCIDSEGYALSHCMAKAARSRLALEKAKSSHIIHNPRNNKKSESYSFKVCSVDNIEHVIEVIQ